MKIQYSVCIPVYNSHQTLETLYERIAATFQPITDRYEIVLVDDGSTDESWAALEKIKKRYSNVKAIRLMRNFGQHNALMCAFRYATGEFLITLDDDLQVFPEDIPLLIKKMAEGYDVVYGAYQKKKHSLFRNFGSGLVQWVYKKVFRLKENLTSFRMVRRQLIELILAYDLNYTFIDGLLAWCTNRIGSVEVRHQARQYGQSGYHLQKLITLSINMMTNFSIAPLQTASLLGVILSIAGFLLGIYFILNKILFGVPIMGFTATVVIITFFSGVQLLSLGLIGEYIGRVHLNINKKPQYLVRQTLD
ncbi:MAG: glycosyltransferase [Candidatus Omnitrophica bacterium CG11_big_fil_rev_8_21_14_0_20_45_26]|uniref:Glycosyltransferase n=1 Tax=Candidatus Abzuiibacterium crystallinum TaxID=1974748 RepID=A0A2H0LLA3_9BACT|nr:MAG: glycosyltransferase [Candidatus Omnitrophica bacterium CG11_big_fil_rev_8_21_14_0_20_45_26]PIW65388.1 MAG: glycosyltransferase [Candidatus Omnitrophica bacterium CG12_big_fil_rev_8_21_14_0_65_45_16]